MRLLFIAIALGEVAVGVAMALFPATVVGFLLGGASIDGAGVVAMRMLGIACVALGLAWWVDRNRLDGQQLRQVAVGFLVYNIGVGLLFLAYAWSADRLLIVPWAVAAVHLLSGGAFGAALTRVPLAAKAG